MVAAAEVASISLAATEPGAAMGAERICHPIAERNILIGQELA